MATYHGIKKIRCNTCGHTTTAKTVMEGWNDYGDGCPACDSMNNTYWLTDGTVLNTAENSAGRAEPQLVTTVLPAAATA